MPATDGGETPIPSRGSMSCEPLGVATLHLGSAHPPALFCTLVPPFRKCVRTVPQVRPHSAAVHPTVPQVRPRRSVGSSPLFRTLRPTVPEVRPRRSGGSSARFRTVRPTVPHVCPHRSEGASPCSRGSSPLFRTERLTVPQVRPQRSARHVPLFLRLVPTVPNSASHCSADSSALFHPFVALFRTCGTPFRTSVPIVPHVRRRGAGVALSASAAGT